MTIASVLTVAGTPYAQPARHTHGLLIDGWGWDLDSDYWCEFHEVAAGPQPQFGSPDSVTITMGSGGSPPLVFAGQVVNVQPALSADGRTWGYRALGLKYIANWLPVTAVDGSGMIRFNVSPVDVYNYVPSFAGQSVGQIISYCLTQHSTQLTAAGITTDGTTATQLAALTLVPNNEVDVSGERLWQAMESVLTQWARNIRLIILPSGLVRLVDITTGTVETFTIGADPVDPPMLSYNWTNCATRVIVRGQGLIEPGYVQTDIVNGVQTLTPAWNSTEQTDWTYQQFTNPSGATDNGAASVTSSTTIVCTSVNGSLSLTTNHWDVVVGWIYLSYSVGTGLTFTESRAITANTSASGGVYTVTVNYALTNTNYDSYKIIGLAVPLADGGLSLVWRLYNVTDPGGLIADHLVRQFPAQVPFIIPNSAGATEVNYPICLVSYLTNGGLGVLTEGVSVAFTVLPATGQILFNQPVVLVNNSMAQLNTGGSAVTAPSNIYMLLAYSRGALETIYPPNSGSTPVYGGTAYSVAGLERTQYVDVPSWTYYGDVSVLNSLAQMLWASVSNTIVEGGVHYRGLCTTMANPTAGGTPGYLLNFDGVDYTTGWESLEIPVRAQSVRYVTDGAGGLIYETDFRVSTRQDPRTGQSFYDHLNVLGTGAFSPRSESSFGPQQMAQPNTSDPFGFGGQGGDDDTFSDFGQSGGMDGGQGGKGKYEDVQARRKRKLKERQDKGPLSLPSPGSTGGLRANDVAATVHSLPSVTDKLDAEFAPAPDLDISATIPDDSSTAAAPADVKQAFQPKPKITKPKITKPTLPGAPSAAPPSAASVPSMGRLPDDFMSPKTGESPPDIGATLPE